MVESNIERDLTFEVVDDLALSAYMNHGLAAHAREESSFCQPAGWRAWATAFLPGNGWSGPLRYYICRERQTICGIIPFARQKISIISIASLAGYYWPYRSIYIASGPKEPNKVLSALGQHLATKPPAAILRFGPISSRDTMMRGVIQELLKAGWIGICKEMGPVFELDLSSGIDALKATASPSLLKHIEYSRRRLAKTAGPITFERNALGDSTQQLEELAKVETRSWLPTKGGQLKFEGVDNQKFWTRLATEAQVELERVVWNMRCNGKAVAFSAHLETDRNIYIIANSYDEEWKSHSPGSLLTLEVLQDGVKRGKRLVDWGQGDSGYKGRWGAVDGSVLYDVMIFKPCFRGRLAAKLAKRALPTWTATLDSLF